MAMFGTKNANQSEKAKLSAKTSSGSDNGKATGESGPGGVISTQSDESDNTSQSERAKALQLAAVRKSLVFTQIISLLMRSPLHKHYSLADLEWLVLPALELGQLKVAEAKTQPDGPSVPAGFLLWANVSPELDKRLSENLSAPIRLRPDEWKSGDIVWLIETVGDPRVMKELLKRVRDASPEGPKVKLRTKSREGKVAIATLGELRFDEKQSSPAQ